MSLGYIVIYETKMIIKKNRQVGGTNMSLGYIIIYGNIKLKKYTGIRVSAARSTISSHLVFSSGAGYFDHIRTDMGLFDGLRLTSFFSASARGRGVQSFSLQEPEKNK